MKSGQTTLNYKKKLYNDRDELQAAEARVKARAEAREIEKGEAY